MIGRFSKIEIMKNDRTYYLLCNETSPLGEVYDVLNEMKSIIANTIKNLDQEQEENENGRGIEQSSMCNKEPV